MAIRRFRRRITNSDINMNQWTLAIVKTIFSGKKLFYKVKPIVLCLVPSNVSHRSPNSPRDIMNI